MAFQQANKTLDRELQNRKILEELQIKKQMLIKQGVQQSLNTPPTIAPAPAQQSGDGPNMSTMQRTALMNAHANSSGYFIVQDSSFGNLILPVLPRYPESSK